MTFWFVRLSSATRIERLGAEVVVDLDVGLGEGAALVLLTLKHLLKGVSTPQVNQLAPLKVGHAHVNQQRLKLLGGVTVGSDSLALKGVTQQHREVTGRKGLKQHGLGQHVARVAPLAEQGSGLIGPLLTGGGPSETLVGKLNGFSSHDVFLPQGQAAAVATAGLLPNGATSVSAVPLPLAMTATPQGLLPDAVAVSTPALVM